jgi:tetratricopeptide (TPR) repeat protein
MKTNRTTTKAQKQMKMAEAAVLFILVLGMTVFVGMRFAPANDLSEIGSGMAAVQTISTEEDVAETPIVVQEIHEEESIVEPEIMVVEPPRIITYATARQAYTDGNFEDAALQFADYTQSHADNAWGFYMLGLSEMKAGDEEGSEIAFQTALAIKPDHVKSLVNYSRLLLTLDRANDARTQIELALVTDPYNVSANRVLGRIYHNLQELESAKMAYRTALSIQPDDVWSLNNLGLINIEQGDYEDAIAPLAKASGLVSDVACFHNNLGVALEKIGQYTAAAEAYASAISADSNYAKAEISLARVGGLEQAYDTVSIDLIALAASFTVTEPATEIAAVEIAEEK